MGHMARGMCIAAALGAATLVAPVPAVAAGAWQPIEDEVYLPGQVNPCTGETTDVTLHLTRLRVSGAPSGTVSTAVDGTYTSTDGSYGRFHDSDRGNVTAHGEVFGYTYRAHYLGWYDGRRQHSAYVISIHESADGVWVTAQLERRLRAGLASRRPSRAGLVAPADRYGWRASNSASATVSSSASRRTCESSDWMARSADAARSPQSER